MFRVVNVLFCVLLLAAALALSSAAPVPKKSVAATKSASRKSTSSAKSNKPASSSRTASRSGTASSKRPVKRKTSVRRSAKRRSRRLPSRHYTRTGQQKPLPERITEIEAALVRQGFLAGEADGVWDQNSIEALKRFQDQHHIQATGKLTSLSLIALGLGPQRTPIANASLPGTIAASAAAAVADAGGSPQERQ